MRGAGDVARRGQASATLCPFGRRRGGGKWVWPCRSAGMECTVDEMCRAASIVHECILYCIV